MPQKSVCLKIPKVQGEKAITLANKLKIINRKLEIKRNKKFIYIPLIYQPTESELEIIKKQIPDVEILTQNFLERKRAIKSLVELLEDKLPPHLLASLPRAIDFVGDIAIVEIPPELNAYKALIGEAILKTHKNVRTVLAKASAVSGVYRLREFNVIAGEHKTQTIHREYGCKYYVDLAKAYFSPRLSNEHHRIASLVKNGETIVDLFAGVGPFAILIAKTHENVKVYAIDANPHAIEFLERNIRLNRVEGKVHPVLGDARQVVEESLVGVADRAIMNLPEKAIEFVDAACRTIKSAGGTLHFYSFVSKSKPLEDVKHDLAEAVKENGRELKKFLFARPIRETAPYEWQVVIDAEIS